MPDTKEDAYKAMLARQKNEEKHGFLLEREKKAMGLAAFGKPGADLNSAERERKTRDGSASRSPSRDRHRERRRDRKDRRSSSGASSSDSRSCSRERRRRKKKRKKRHEDRDGDQDRRKFRETSGSPDAELPSTATTALSAETEKEGASAASAGLCVHSARDAAAGAAAAGAGPAPHAMEVAEGLYLGNATVCASAEGVQVLRLLGVTHVINATTLAPMPRVPEDAEGPRVGFSCTRIPLSADPSAPVAKYFEQAASAVHAAVSSRGKVLLCCVGASESTAANANANAAVHAGAGAAGMGAGAGPLGSMGSASAALGLYYMMRHRGASLREGLEALWRAQPSALPSVWHAQRLMEAEVRMHELPQPTVSADEYRRLCLLQLCHRATAAADSGAAPATADEVEALTSRLRAARQRAASLIGTT